MRSLPSSPGADTDRPSAAGPSHRVVCSRLGASPWQGTAGDHVRAKVSPGRVMSEKCRIPTRVACVTAAQTLLVRGMPHTYSRAVLPWVVGRILSGGVVHPAGTGPCRAGRDVRAWPMHPCGSQGHGARADPFPHPLSSVGSKVMITKLGANQQVWQSPGLVHGQHRYSCRALTLEQGGPCERRRSSRRLPVPVLQGSRRGGGWCNRTAGRGAFVLSPVLVEVSSSWLLSTTDGASGSGR